jgi:hypothetical protein
MRSREDSGNVILNAPNDDADASSRFDKQLHISLVI